MVLIAPVPGHCLPFTFSIHIGAWVGYFVCLIIEIRYFLIIL